MASGHQITITPTDEHVEVFLGGEKLASSDRAVVLAETGLPDRYYLPAGDVRTAAAVVDPDPCHRAEERV